MTIRAGIASGQTPASLRAWRAVPPGTPEGLHYVGNRGDSVGRTGDAFAFCINGANERAPAAAQALAERVGE